MRIVILILGLFMANFLQAQYELEPLQGEYYIVARSGLNMRETASKTAKKMKKVPYSAKVNVLKVDDEVINIDWLRGYWTLVEYKNRKGYVFSSYLNKLQPPQTFEPAENCDMFEEMGAEQLLSDYVKELRVVDSAKILYQLPRTDFDEGRMEISRQNLEHDAQLIEEMYYEGGSTILRFTGDIYQAYTLLEAIGYPCENIRKKISDCRVVRNSYSSPIRIEDKVQGGWIFEIKQLDAVTVQISMSSGI